MRLDEYQEKAARTDVSSTPASHKHLILGLFGEAGSVLSVVKKQSRDATSSLHYYESSKEELGDLLWYLAVAAKNSGLSLGMIAKPLRIKTRLAKKSADMLFSDIQTPRLSIQIAPNGYLEWILMQLGQDVGRLIEAQRDFVKGSDRKKLRESYTLVLRRVLDVANRVGLSLEEIAYANLEKTADRWPEDRINGYPPQFDRRFPSYERLPRRLTVDIIEVETSESQYFVYQSCQGIHIGDRLTDNIEYSDEYRFHDVFHYAYAAVLGWSPVLRAILKLKRKSKPNIDQNEDGARAILIEEGITALVYNEAKREGHLFSDVERGKLNFDLLKTIRSFVRGYEVEHVPYWVWEEAILQGFEVFRYLVNNREARVTLDCANRQLVYGPIPRRGSKKVK